MTKFEKFLKVAKMLKVFTKEDVMIAFGDTMPLHTYKNYIKNLTKAGCIQRIKRGQYKFIHENISQTRQGGIGDIKKTIKGYKGEFSARDIMLKAGSNTAKVRTVIAQMVLEEEVKQTEKIGKKILYKVIEK